MNPFRLIVSMALLSLLVAVFALTPALAQMGQGQGGQGMPKMGCEERFQAMDANGDGKITQEEFMSGPHAGVGNKPLEESFKVSDANSDNALSKDEFCAGKGAHGGMGQGGMGMGSGGMGKGKTQ